MSIICPPGNRPLVMPETESQEALFDEFSAVDAEEWQNAAREDLGGADLDDFLEWSSIDGISIPAYLQREDLGDLPHVASEAKIPPLSDAAERPRNDWTVCQIIDHPDPETANEHARTALDGGATDLQLCYGPTASRAPSLHPTSPEDLTTLLDGIDVSTTGFHLGDGLVAPVLYGALCEHLTGRGINPDALRGSVRYDPVAAVAAGHVGTVDRAFSLAYDLLGNTANFPRFRSVSIDARVYHDAGASAVQELACTLGALTERIARSTERGAALSTVLDDLQFIVSVSTPYFVEIAKLRALRLLVPQVIEPFLSSVDTDRSVSASDVHLQVETSRRTETIYDPYVNMLRATTEAMAAVIGGCDTLTVRPYDAALCPPDDFGTRIARNTQHVLRHEAHLDQVADPAAGAYYVETLTDKLAQQAWTQFQDLEANGGIVEAIRDGTLQQRIGETRQKRRDAIDEREHVLVGTTHYPSLDEQRRDDLAPPTEAPSTNRTASSPLPSPSLDAIRAALRNEATLPAITAALQNDESPIDPLPRIRVAEEIESIRLRTEAYAEAHDGPPRVLLAPLGPPAARSARATFARNFLGVAGMAIEEPLTFESVDEAADAAVEANADAVVLCSANAEYADLAPALTSALEERDHDALLLIAGAPDDIDAGDHADLFIHQDSPLQDTLTTLQERFGIPLKSDA